MFNSYVSEFMKLVIAVFVALSQSSVGTASANVAILKAGDEIAGMTLRTGAKDAPPIWAFCSSEDSQGVTVADCWVPQLPALAIGHVFLPSDHPLSHVEWSRLEWELYLDDQLISLEDFNTYHYIVPTLDSNLSAVREVFKTVSAWDVVLANLQPGEYTLEGRVRSDVEEYRWIVNLVVEGKPAPYWKSFPKHDDREDLRSSCSGSGKWVSRFQGPCKLYG